MDAAAIADRVGGDDRALPGAQHDAGLVGVGAEERREVAAQRLDQAQRMPEAASEGVFGVRAPPRRHSGCSHFNGTRHPFG